MGVIGKAGAVGKLRPGRIEPFQPSFFGESQVLRRLFSGELAMEEEGAFEGIHTCREVLAFESALGLGLGLGLE